MALPARKVAIDAAARVAWPVLVLAVLYSVALTVLLGGNYVGLPPTGRLEQLAIPVLYLALATAIVRYRVTRAPFFLWLATLDAGFLLREYHWALTGELVYVNAAVLAAVAVLRYERFADYLESSTVMTLLATVVLLYLISIGFDQHWWRFLSQSRLLRSTLEEVLELSGHAVLLLLNLVATPRRPGREGRLPLHDCSQSGR
jgi:hypothetical protein